MPAFDHVYRHLAEGVVIPHGIFDMLYDESYISIGNSHKTAPFITGNLIWWWDYFGIHRYSNARNVLILCDAGGGNSYRHHAFKKAMLEFNNKLTFPFLFFFLSAASKSLADALALRPQAVLSIECPQDIHLSGSLVHVFRLAKKINGA